MLKASAYLLLILGLGGCATNPPAPADGLAPCPASPNCVSSEADAASRHHIAGIALRNLSAEAALALLTEAIELLRGSIVARSDLTVSARFESDLLGFVDDLDCRVDVASGLIHVRSASRLGFYDLGANRRRVEALRQQFESLRQQYPELSG